MAQELLYSFIGIFVAMDVIGTLPVFLGITRGLEGPRKSRLVNLAVAVAAGVAVVFAMAGPWIFKALGIAIYDFKVGGGIVLLVMAILDLIRRHETESKTGPTGVVPLGVPLITGPGTIATIMLQMELYNSVIVFISMVLNFSFAWIALRQSSRITRVIGEEGTDVVSKIAALLMTAIAFAMIRTGIFEAIRQAR